MLFFDSRSTLHSAIQDRRLLDAYRDWLNNNRKTHLVEEPWFGFSSFYIGLQLADFYSYIVDFMENNSRDEKDRNKLKKAYNLIKDQVILLKIP